MSEISELEEKRGRDRVDQVIEIKVNNHEITVTGHRQTGRSIKEAAIAQGANIQLDFVLSIERGNGKTKIIGDDDEVTVNENSCFLAIPNDDNSRGLRGNVEAAIDRIRQNFPKTGIEVTEDGGGGAFLVVEAVSLGKLYAQASSWVGFHITAACEHADCYPHFVRPDLIRADGAPLGGGFSSTTFAIPGSPRQAVQISRRTNRPVTPSVSNPLLKLLKVLEWLRSR